RISQPSADANRREIKHTLALQGNPRVPKLLHAFEKDTWVTLIYELVDGRHPELPWNADELDFALSELSALSASLSSCTPPPKAFRNSQRPGRNSSADGEISLKRDLS
ncbi:MAG: hypothetical protein ACXWP5_13275, partial [Bdellovibrionota bacterium]